MNEIPVPDGSLRVKSDQALEPVDSPSSEECFESYDLCTFQGQFGKNEVGSTQEGAESDTHSYVSRSGEGYQSW